MPESTTSLRRSLLYSTNAARASRPRFTAS
jgi:hypothetical protein